MNFAGLTEDVFISPYQDIHIACRALTNSGLETEHNPSVFDISHQCWLKRVLHEFQ